MSKNLKTLICCILALLFVSGTVIAVFADSNVLSDAKESESVTAEDVTGEEESGAETVIKLGDVNFDGVIKAADARLALRIAAGLDVPTAEEFAAADVITDGKVKAGDARLILRVAAGLDSEADFGAVAPEVESDSDVA